MNRSKIGFLKNHILICKISGFYQDCLERFLFFSILSLQHITAFALGHLFSTTVIFSRLLTPPSLRPSALFTVYMKYLESLTLIWWNFLYKFVIALAFQKLDLFIFFKLGMRYCLLSWELLRIDIIILRALPLKNWEEKITRLQAPR